MSTLSTKDIELLRQLSDSTDLQACGVSASSAPKQGLLVRHRTDLKGSWVYARGVYNWTRALSG